MRAIPIGLLPTDVAVDGRTGRVFVSEENDAEYQRYGYRSISTGAPDAWSWVPRPGCRTRHNGSLPRSGRSMGPCA